MRVNESFDIEQDKYNFILVEKKVHDGGVCNGKAYPPGTTTDRSFYPTLEKACMALVRKSIATPDILTILSTIEQSTSDVIAAINATK